jgi:hypothetical protein
MVTALDCYQKLIAHGFLRGIARITPSSNTETSTSENSKNQGPSDEAANNDEVTVSTYEKAPASLNFT